MTDHTNRIRFASSKNSPVRCYAVSANLTVEMMDTVVYRLDQPLPAHREVYADTVRAAEKLQKLGGITHLIVRQKELFVLLADGASWDSIHEQVIAILTEEIFASRRVLLEDYCQH
ncbi:MAG: hypothetical protein KC777_11190 [Cyanobacteria bacterium HKST-UBA02]|nr:hypothetical protein [Cyanobacteria bacterium HKST-UBA02]